MRQVTDPSRKHPVSDSPVCVGLSDHQNSDPVCILDRDGTVLANAPSKNDRQAISAAVAGHSARPRGDVAGP